MAIKVFELYGDVELRDAKLKTGLRSANKEFNDFERNAKARIKGVEGSFSGMGAQMGNFLSRTGANIAGNLITGGIDKVVTQMKDITTRGMELSDMVQKARLGYGQALGSDEKSVALIKELVELGNKTQFKTGDVLHYGQQLLSVGMQANEVTQALRDLGDAAASTGNFDKFERALVGITQMLSKGKVSMEEMRQQLSEAIPGSQGMMARGLGISEPEMIKLMGEGRINAGPAVRLMLMQMRKERGGYLDKTADSTFESLQSRKMDAEAVAMMLSLHGGDMFNVKPDSARAARIELMKHQIARREALAGGNASNTFGKIASAYFGLVDKDEEFLFSDSKIKDFFLDLGADVATAPGMTGPDEIGKGIGRKIAPGWKGLDEYIPFLKYLNPSWEDLGLGGSKPQGASGMFKNVVGTSIDAVEKGSGPMQQAGNVLAASLEKGIDDVWEFGSPSRKATQMGMWIREGLEIGLNKGQAKNYANLQALTKADPDFLRTLGIEAGKRGVNPDDMLNLIGIESSFNKSVVNRFGYGGLGQVGRDERKALGLPVDDGAFKKLLDSNSASWQLSNVLFPFLDMKLKSNKGVRSGGISLAELYAMWGSGHATGDPDAIHMTRGGKRASAYANNPLWDFNKDGVVRESEFGQAAAASLGAGKAFSVNGQVSVSQSNPMPVAVVDYGNSVQVDLRTGRPLGEKPIEKMQMMGGRIQDPQRPRMITDTVPVNVDVAISKTEKPLTTFNLALNESALNLKKLATVTSDATTATGTASDAEIAKLRAEAIVEGKAKKKRDPLFDAAFTREGLAGDFQGNLSSLLGGIGWEKTSSLGKQALFGLIRDAQGRLAHDFSSMITGALFGSRGEDGKLTGGLFGGGNWLSGIFGKLFGGFRASGGSMSPGRFYMAGENGPELIAGPGHVYNAGQTREMMSRGGGDTHVMLALGDRAVADMNDHYVGSRRGMRKMIRVNARYGRAVHV